VLVDFKGRETSRPHFGRQSKWKKLKADGAVWKGNGSEEPLFDPTSMHPIATISAITVMFRL
jgi:hypothetical protein